MAARYALFALAALLMAAPMASAHDTVKGLENEVFILSDFADDVSYEVGSWDLWDIYVGEASLPDVGDGFYFHTRLFGDYAKRMAGETEFKATFTFVAPGGAVTRSLSTKDGKTFATDFDALQAKFVKTDVDVQRAFVSYAKAGLAPGMELKGFKVETFVDGDLRDRAPGGYFMPKSGGKVEKPESSVVKAPSYKLGGTGTYFSVMPTVSAGKVNFAVQNTFKDTSQLVKVHAPASASWKFTVSGEGTAQLPGGKSSLIQATLTPIPDASGLVQPAAFDLRSDLGGRVGLIATVVNGGAVVVPEGAAVAAGRIAAAPGESPALDAGLALVGLFGMAVAMRRRAG